MPKQQAARIHKHSQEVIVLQPSRLLMFGNYVAMFSLAIAIGWGVRWLFNRESFGENWFNENGLITLVIILFGSLLVAFIDHGRWTLRLINGEELEGPTGAIGDRMVIPVREIDWTRTRRSLSSRLKIGNGIYAHSRQRILISPWFYTPQKYRDFMDELGL